MFRILACLYTEHKFWLVAVAALICALSFTGAAFVHVHLTTLRDSKRRASWIFSLGLLCGGGAWATHFLAMLGFQPQLPISYDPWWTIASAIIGVGGAWASFAISNGAKSKRDLAVAGLAFAATLIGLHYSGMAGILIAARKIWALDIVLISFVICAALCVAGMLLPAFSNVAARPFKSKALLALGVVSLHFTGMGALTLSPDPRVETHAQAISGPLLAVLISTLLLATLIIVSLLAVADAKIVATKLAGANRFRRLANASLDGLVIHDGAFVVEVNDQFSDWLGLAHDKITGSAIADYGLTDAIASEHATETVLQTKIGRLEVEITTRFLSEGVFASTIHDISNRRRAEAAERENLSKSQFLANMSHELRTPLSTIIAYAEMINETAEADDRATDVDDSNTILLASHHLLSMISEILDISKIEAGRMSVSATDFLLSDLLASLVREAQPLVLKNGNILETCFDANIGLLHTDHGRLRQCLLNLLSNAAKFTSSGEVQFSAHFEQRNSTQGIRFAVRDTGIGMSPDTLSKLFKPFAQADDTITRKYGGTGLGLAITKELATLLGGDIEVTSQEGKGTTFRLWVSCDLSPKTSNSSKQTEDIAA